MKYDCYAVIDACKFIGTFEADTKEKAAELAEESFEPESLCNQCSGSVVDLGDLIRVQVDESDPPKKEKTITVCSACLQESCWKGEFYCDEYKTAGTVEIEAPKDK